jgi:cystathionine beta-lyase
MEHANVALSDGHHFGEGFEGHARLNFATSRAILDRVLESIESVVVGGRAA